MPVPSRRVFAILVAFGALSLAALGSTALGSTAQRAPDRTSIRKTTTVPALLTYPVFFHNQAVRIRGELTGTEGQTPWYLNADGRQVMVMPSQKTGTSASLPNPGASKTTDIVGYFLDVGRLEQGDPKATSDLGELSQRLVHKPWPGPGEMLVLVAERTVTAESLPAPSVRALALDPDRYVGQQVSVVGRFRGRNLFGDLPDAPGISRWDFVLSSADGAIWVAGRRPKGDNFDLNVEQRVDTGRWLEVHGTVRLDRGLVRIDATDIRSAQAPPPSNDTEVTVQLPEKGPPPEAIFSAPTQDETDVSTTAPIRIQFSRDLDAKSIKGQIVVTYVGPAPQGASASPPASTTTYDEGRRVMEIRFATPPEPFRTIQVKLGTGITGTDGQPLKPFTLSFTTGR
jgi:Bacterial Ig-like domain